jgi:ribonuclease E
MSKKMLVNASHPEENRVAIVENGLLTELDIEVAGREPTKGNIYKAVVVRVETGLQAAFVDYGAERLGFLQIDEINFSTVKPDYQSDENRRPRINDLLHRGQELLVQITKEERGTKGAALTTYLSLAGRYMVLMPGSQTRGVSRKAESDSQRKELKKAMSSIDLAEGVGYIVRTAALDQSREELERDYRYLMRLFDSIKALEQKAKAPALIYKESNLMIRSIRDYFTTDMDEVLIDDPQVFKEAKDFFQLVMPDQAHLVKQHQERRPIFSRYQIEEQIETLSRNKVLLPSGGSIVIDPTEALVAIDVNSGKMASEQGVEATATKTNLEAAEEVGRQLRLRDLGGLIVIDFIDMRERKHMRQVENLLKKSLENDKARVSVGRISQFGLLEMSRQRIKAALTQGSYLTCPHCNGSGHLKSPETQAVALLRKIHASAAKGQVSRVDAQLPMDVAAYLLNNKREELVDMERRYQLQIHIHGNRDFLADQNEIEIQKKEKEKAAQQEYIAAGMLPQDAQEKDKSEGQFKPADTVKPEAQEKPEGAQQPGGEPEAQEAVEPGAEPAKKRRRRRRRKPAVATAGEESIEAETSTEQAEEAGSETGNEPPAAPDSTPAGETPATSATKKSPRRRRSSKAKSTVQAGEENAPVVPSPAIVEESAPAEQSPDAGTAAQNTAEAKPKRRRSRRKPKPSENAALPGTPAAASQPVQADGLPKPATMPAQQLEAPASSAVVKDTGHGPTAKLAGATVADAAPGKPLMQSTPQKQHEASTDKPKAEAQKASRGRRSKPKPKDADALVPAETKPAEAKPARKAPARRSSKAAVDVTVTAEKDGASAINDKPAAGSKETTPKPKRRRVAKKLPSAKDPAAGD